jgi:uncharacterized protein (TIGR01777 family)
MRVMIAGGSGLIGRALTKSLVADDHEVEIVSRNPDAVNNLPSIVKTYDWNKRTLAEQLEETDAVVNLAGASIAGESLLKIRWTTKRKKQILESRVTAGKILARAIESAGKKPEVLIQSSAVGFYGPLADKHVDENFPNGNDFLAQVCREWEESTRIVESLGARRVVIRTGLVFSHRGGIFQLLKLPFSLYLGGHIGNGQQYLSWIHMDDVVNGIRFLMHNEAAQGIYNLSSPNPLKNKDFARILGKAMKRPSRLPVPSFAAKLAIGEAATLALDGQRVIPKRLLEAGYNFIHETFTDALPSLLRS